MPKKTLASIQQYIRWVISQYQTLQHEQKGAHEVYRIVNRHINDDGECQLTIQVIGKSITFKCSPEEIAADDKMLRRFSPLDVRTITFYACQEIKKPKVKIVAQEFCDKLNKMIFKMKKRGQKEILSKTAGEITLDKSYNEMSQEEAHLIGYATASDHISEEKIQKEKLNNTGR